jgi:hypothetical protein
MLLQCDTGVRLPLTGYAGGIEAGIPTAVENELMKGERLLWFGRPDPNRFFARNDVFLIPFSLMWGGFAIFWEISVIREGWGFGVVWGIPFVAIGLYMIAGRFLVKSRRRRRTHYALTDKRVLIVDGGGSTRAAFLSSIPTIDSRLRSDGSGTIIFGNPSWTQAAYADSGTDFFGSDSGDWIGFHDIPDARSVVDLVNEQRSRPSSEEQY